MTMDCVCFYNLNEVKKSARRHSAYHTLPSVD